MQKINTFKDFQTKLFCYNLELLKRKNEEVGGAGMYLKVAVIVGPLCQAQSPRARRDCNDLSDFEAIDLQWL